MLQFFPIPCPDELFYSLVCRYHIRSGNRGFRQTQLDLFDTEGTKQYYLGLPNNLATLIDRLPLGSNLTINQLLEKHTLFPYYRTFLTFQEVRRLQELMEGKESQSIARVAKIPKLKLYYPEYLKFCPQCLKNDVERYGEAYWHRSHQAPGIEVCLIHRVQLHDSVVPVKIMGKSFVAASEENCLEAPDNDNEPVLEEFWRLGKFVEDKIGKKDVFKEFLNLRDNYKRDLMNTGLLDREKLAEAMVERFGEKLLGELYPEMMEHFGDYVMGCLLGCDLLQEVDRVVHWLATVLLEPQNPLEK
jgi:hypothetical protein